MSIARRWSWIPLLLLALVAVVFPALLQAKPAPAPAGVATVAAANPTLPVDELSPPATETNSETRLHADNELQNLSLSAATGFAGGLTAFFCIAGWGLFRVSLSRNAAISALLAATVACLAGFLLGFSAFLQVIGS